MAFFQTRRLDDHGKDIEVDRPFSMYFAPVMLLFAEISCTVPDNSPSLFSNHPFTAKTLYDPAIRLKSKSPNSSTASA